MSEYQMEQLLGVLRDMREDINSNLEYIALCMILNTITSNGARKITANERQDLLKVVNGADDVSLLLFNHLMNAVRPRACRGDKE